MRWTAGFPVCSILHVTAPPPAMCVVWCDPLLHMTKKAKIAWIALAVAVWGIGVYFWVWYPFEEIERSVGKFDTREAAVKASIKRLSQELRRRPGTQRYIVWFRIAQRDPVGSRAATVYCRRFQQFGWAGDPTSGFDDSWDNIGDSTIHAIAATNGSFASLAKPRTPETSNAP
jgi:hypothetical protein